MNIEKNWYILHTNINTEKKVIDSLCRKKVEYYFPLNYTKVYNSKKLLSQPLFPSFVFVFTNMAEIESLKQIPGVVNIIYWRKQPATIPDDEIEILKNFVGNSFKSIQIRKISVTAENISHSKYFNIEEFEGKTNTEKLLLPSLGYLLYCKKETAIETSPVHFSFRYKNAI
jgi:transcription antitermination factor NusG